MCIVRWSYSSPVICEGLVKMENNKGYYFDGDDWVRDDSYAKRAYDNSRYDCDWMDIGDADGLTAEEELTAAKASIKRRIERAKKGDKITADDVRAETDRHGLGTLKLIKEDIHYKYFMPLKDVGMEKVNQHHYPSVLKASIESGYIYFANYSEVCKILDIEPFVHTGKERKYWFAKYTTADDGSILECSSYARVHSFDDGDDCFEFKGEGNWYYMPDKTLESYAGYVMLGNNHIDLFEARQCTLGLENESGGGIKSHTDIGPLGDGGVDLETGRPTDRIR